jgi:hypothetical protein
MSVIFGTASTEKGSEITTMISAGIKKKPDKEPDGIGGLDEWAKKQGKKLRRGPDYDVIGSQL